VRFLIGRIESWMSVRFPAQLPTWRCLRRFRASRSTSRYITCPREAACSKAAPNIEEGAPIEITFPDDVKARGQVIWRKMGFAGVEFLHWLDPSLIEHLGYPEPPGGLDLWDPQDQLGKELLSALPNFSRLH
jgi:hypothetical protein